MKNLSIEELYVIALEIGVEDADLNEFLEENFEESDDEDNEE